MNVKKKPSPTTELALKEWIMLRNHVERREDEGTEKGEKQMLCWESSVESTSQGTGKIVIGKKKEDSFLGQNQER